MRKVAITVLLGLALAGCTKASVTVSGDRADIARFMHEQNTRFVNVDLRTREVAGRTELTVSSRGAEGLERIGELSKAAARERLALRFSATRSILPLP